MRLFRWLRRQKKRREARRLLDVAFDNADLLKGTSLKQHHRVRSQIVEFDEEGGRIAKIRFGILRHPRPYAFSRQSHKVIEYYEYDLEAEAISILQGVNWTRREGRDAD
jgi:hypothetical protein